MVIWSLPDRRWMSDLLLATLLTVVAPSLFAAEETNDIKLDEIIVTAQKRSERLMDVPASISAIGGERLETLQVNSLSDLADYVPGLSVTDGGAPGSRLIVIRGLSTGYLPTTGALVGTYVDDLPVGDSSSITSARFGLDLNPYDIDRIEVLKGPQGTLYGANTMGGLVKYALRQPDLREFEIEAGTDVSDTKGSGQPNWGVRGAVNLPIVADSLAVRLSGFDKYSAGYIDNVTTGERNINHSKENGGRATIFWKATDALTLRATVLAQDVSAANLSAVTLDGTTLQPLSGPFTLSSYFREPNTQQSRIYSLGIDWNLNFATLTSSSGWSRIGTAQTSDVTGGFGLYTPGNPDALVAFSLATHASKFVEEVRLTSPENQTVQWMLGGYYTKVTTEYVENTPPFTPSYVALPTNLLDLYIIAPNTYKESAGFVNVTYKVTDLFDISGGARYSDYTESSCIQTAEGIFDLGVQTGCSNLPSTGVSVWMANARFHLNEDAMFYARAASGYRPGSGCPGCGQPALGIPGIVSPDKTVNYELGFKGSFLDRRLHLELSAFHIDWTNIQITQFTSQGIVYPGNAGTAVSNGFELTTAYRVKDELRLNATLGYTDAHLTQIALNAGGQAGDELPGSPRWTGSLTADYSHSLDGTRTLLAGMGYRYRDAVVNQFAHSGEPLPLGPQNIADLYTGLEIRGATIRLYGTNVFNNKSYAGLIYIDDPTKPNFVPVQPRTIGLSVDYKYK